MRKLDRGESRVSLVVLSETITSDEMVALAGVPPDRAWAKSEQRRPGALHPFAGISYEVDDECDRPPEEQLGRLLDRLDRLDRLDPAAEQIARLAATSGVHSARIWIHNWTPEEEARLVLDAGHAARLARHGIALFFDAYFDCQYEDEDPGSTPLPAPVP